MRNDNVPPAHTCPHCGAQTIWITRAGEHDVEGCPRCTQVGLLPESTSDWLSADLEIDDDKEKERSGSDV